MSGVPRHSRFSARFTVAVAFLVALLFPLGYFFISYHHAVGSLEAEAEINSRIVAGLIAANPELWRFEHERLEDLLSRRPQSGQAEVRRILDARGREVAASGVELQRPLISRSQPLMDAGLVVGRIEISRSLMPLLKQSGVVAIMGSLIGLIVFILLPFRAISRAERQIIDSYSFLTSVMESSTNAIIVLNLEGSIELCNGRCCLMSGYRREELLEMPVEKLFPTQASETVLQMLEQVAAGTEMAKFETDLLRSDGVTVSISCGAAPRSMDGRVSGTVLTVEDITERNLAAQQLRNAKEYTENLIQAANVIIVGMDAAGAVTLMNRTAEEVTGYLAGELIGRNWFETVASTERFAWQGPADGTRSGLAEAQESQIVTKSGALRTISWRNSTITEEGACVGTLSFGIDVTEHKMVEAQLRQSQKMESIGQLAGGVAHDFNNMLSVILGYTQLSELEAAEGTPLCLYLQEIAKAGERSRDMVRQLLAFSRKEIISPKVVDLNAHCLGTQKTLGRLIGEEIRLSFHPASDLWQVKIDPSQLDQVLMNLAVNARDAMPLGGSLAIETANAAIGEAYCHYNLDARPGDYACLTVRDNGTGMAASVAKRIFEPFFTTKEVGRGTGLGLATVYGIVTQNHGFIDVETEVGRGTAFMIYLPRLVEESEPAQPEPAQAPSGSGRVLVVEDDTMLLTMATQMLERIGYQVVRAETPLRAMEICRDANVHLDLVLSDVVMPGMNGKELALEIAQLRPELKVLFMSGYSSDIVANRGIIGPGTHFIQKPFDMESLNQKIRETLQPAAEAPAL